MKTLAIVLGIVLVALAGYVFYSYATLTPAPAETTEESPASAGKLDINAVCEGALAYMTFSDGASADAFVAECKEGKHPEVIEKYKADMQLGEDAAI